MLSLPGVPAEVDPEAKLWRKAQREMAAAMKKVLSNYRQRTLKSAH